MSPSGQEETRSFFELKQFLYNKIVDRLDLSKVDASTRDVLRAELRQVLRTLCDIEDPDMHPPTRDLLISEVVGDILARCP